jgi:hypothetical protein
VIQVGDASPVDASPARHVIGQAHLEGLLRSAQEWPAPLAAEHAAVCKRRCNRPQWPGAFRAVSCLVNTTDGQNADEINDSRPTLPRPSPALIAARRS